MTLKLPIQEICDKYLSGMSGEKLGKEYDCDPGTICGLLKRNGIKLRGNKIHFSGDEIYEICNKYLSGISTNKLSKEYGYDFGTIIRLLLRSDIKIRTLSESVILAYEKDPSITIRQSEIRTLAYNNDPILTIRKSEDMKQAYINDPTFAERVSAGNQGQIYPDEWTGFADRGRSHLIPASRCLQLNPWFEGCVKHHITIGVIIHIPVDLHRSIWHRMPNGDRKDKNMKEINKLAFKYLLGEL